MSQQFYEVNFTEKFEFYKAHVLQYGASEQCKLGKNWLSNATRVKVREACIELVKIGLEESDEPILRSVLKMAPSEINYLLAANKRDADHYKSVENFLIDPSIKTSRKNVDFIAWLFGFPHRPFIYFETIDITLLPVLDGLKTGESTTGSPAPPPPPPSQLKQLPWWSFAEAAVLCLGILLQFHFVNIVKVYVCDSHTASKYHFKPNCSGLNRCTHPILNLDEGDAKKRGLLACKFESR